MRELCVFSFVVISCNFSCNGCQQQQISDIGLESVLYPGYFRFFLFRVDLLIGSIHTSVTDYTTR
jgi:hypothetical protein